MNAGRNISLTDRLNRFIDAQVEQGRHQNASEVVREALRRYELELAEDEARIEALRAVAAAGREAIARGDCVDLDGHEAIAGVIGEIDAEAAHEVEGERARRRG